jgi:effector-binding domain-containing protein
MEPRFSIKTFPSIRVACARWSGPHKDSRIRSEFERVAKWAQVRELRIGRWILLEPGHRLWEVCLELKSPAKGDGRVRVRTLPAATVLSVVFNPEEVDLSALWKTAMNRVRRLRDQGKIARVGMYREVYHGNPWTDAKAWARTNGQVVVYRAK